MNIHADAKQAGKSNAVANNTIKGQSTGEAALTGKSELQEMVNDSPQAKQLRAYSEMANNSPQAKQLKSYQQLANNNIVQRVIDTDAKALSIANHILTNHPKTKPKNLKLDSAYITAAVAAIVPAITYTNTDAELTLIKQKITLRRAEIQAAADAAELARKTALNAFYAMNATDARAHLDTLTAQAITNLRPRCKVFRSYDTRWGLGSEYMFENGSGPLAQFVVHVHWNANLTRSAVRLKPHTDKTRTLPGLVVLDSAKATALGIPLIYGEAEMLVKEQPE